MNSQQIISAVKEQPFLQKVFKGVFAFDQIPEKALPGYYIINLDPSYKPGSHWVCAKIIKGKRNIFFDSYGFPPKGEKLKIFLGKNTQHNKKRLQNSFSTACGQWCLFFMYFSEKKFSLQNIVKKFSSKYTYANDFFVNEIVKDKFKVKTFVVDKHFLKKQIVRSFQTNLLCCEYYCVLNKKKKCIYY